MSGKTMHYAQGAVIQLENSQNPGYIYVIKSGKINIQTGIPKKSNLSQYHPGDTYGFVSALTGNPFTSTLVATSDTEVIRLSIDSFYEYLRNNKEVFIRFLSNHSERLREYVESLSTVRIRAKRDSFEKLYYHCKTYQKLGKQDLASFALTKFIKLAESSGKNIRNLEDAKKQIQELAPDYNLPKHSQVSGKANLTLQRGEIIFLENEPDDYFYFVIQGKVKITKLIDDEEFILAILEEDEIFGEMGILNSKVRNASAIAYEDCVLLRLTPDNIFDDIDNFVLSQLFHSFARRIWYANQRFRLLGIRNPLLKIYMQLKMLVTDQVTKEKLDDSVKEFEFTIGPDELKKMVGIYSSSAEVFEELQNDTNLVMGRQQIKVKDRQKLEAKYSILYKKSLMEKK